MIKGFYHATAGLSVNKTVFPPLLHMSMCSEDGSQGVHIAGQSSSLVILHSEQGNYSPGFMVASLLCDEISGTCVYIFSSDYKYIN